MSFESEGEKGNQTSVLGVDNDSVVKEEASIRSPGPGPGDHFPTVKKRKSGTFWRRRSSMGLATTFGPNSGTGVGMIDMTNGATSGNSNTENTALNGDHEETAINELEYEKQLPDVPLSPVTNLEKELVPQRSYSPPPQIPDFIGGGVGLGGEDMFKDIQ